MRQNFENWDIVTVEPSSCTCKRETSHTRLREGGATTLEKVAASAGYTGGAAAVRHRGDAAEGVELEGDLDCGAVLVQAVEQLRL